MKKIILLMTILIMILISIINAKGQTTTSTFHPDKFIIGASMPPNLSNNKAVPFTGDFDGDGKSDLCTYSIVTSNGSAKGRWSIDKSAVLNGSDQFDKNIFDEVYELPLTDINGSGINLDPTKAHPITADYNNDGIIDFGIKTDEGYWLIYYTKPNTVHSLTTISFTNNQWDWIGSGFGGADCIAVPGNYYNFDPNKSTSPDPNTITNTIGKHLTYLAIRNNTCQQWII